MAKSNLGFSWPTAKYVGGTAGLVGGAHGLVRKPDPDEHRITNALRTAAFAASVTGIPIAVVIGTGRNKIIKILKKT